MGSQGEGESSDHPCSRVSGLRKKYDGRVGNLSLGQEAVGDREYSHTGGDSLGNSTQLITSVTGKAVKLHGAKKLREDQLSLQTGNKAETSFQPPARCKHKRCLRTPKKSAHRE